MIGAAIPCGPAGARGIAARVCGRSTRGMAKISPICSGPRTRDEPERRHAPGLPDPAPPPAARRFGCRRAESPQRPPRAWRRPSPAHRGPARAPSTPTFRWKNGESCPRRTGDRSPELASPWRSQSADGAGTPDSSRRSAESAARSEDNSMPHPLAPWTLTVSPDERRPPSAGHLPRSRLLSNRTRPFRASWIPRQPPGFPLSGHR